MEKVVSIYSYSLYIIFKACSISVMISRGNIAGFIYIFSIFARYVCQIPVAVKIRQIYHRMSDKGLEKIL